MTGNFDKSLKIKKFTSAQFLDIVSDFDLISFPKMPTFRLLEKKIEAIFIYGAYAPIFTRVKEFSIFSSYIILFVKNTSWTCA